MSGAGVAMVSSIVIAVVVLVVMLVAHRPDEGFGPWLRDAFDAWRGRGEGPPPAAGDDDDAAAGVGEIFAIGEPVDGPAYAEVPDLRDVLAHRARDADQGR